MLNVQFRTDLLIHMCTKFWAPADWLSRTCTKLSTAYSSGTKLDQGSLLRHQCHRLTHARVQGDLQSWWPKLDILGKGLDHISLIKFSIFLQKVKSDISRFTERQSTCDMKFGNSKHESKHKNRGLEISPAHVLL